MGRPILLLAIFWALLISVRGEGFLSRTWQSEDGLPGNIVRAVAQASDDYLWVATAEGVVRFDGDKFHGFENPGDDMLARIPPRHLFPLDDGKMGIATAKGGLTVWNGKRLIQILKDSQRPQSPIVTRLIPRGTSLFIRRGDECWVTENLQPPSQIPAESEKVPEGFHAPDDPESGRLLPGMQDIRLRDRRGRLWLSENGRGLDLVRPDGSRMPLISSGTAISCIAEDREGNLWIALDIGGLRRIRERRVEMSPEASGTAIPTAVFQDKAGVWWIGDRNGDVARIARDSVSRHTLTESGTRRLVSAIFEDSSDRLWAATRDGTVFRWDDGSFKIPFRGDDVSKVGAITEDASGHLWFGGAYGLVRWDGENYLRFDQTQGVEGVIHSLAHSLDGTIWAGTHDGRLYAGDAEGFSPVEGARDLINGHGISSILADPSGRLWITTHGAGLLTRSPDGSWTRINTSRGLPDNRLTTVVKDQAGDIWLGSLGGIFRGHQAHLVQPNGWIPWLRLDRSDGLLTRECIGVSQPSGWLGQDGSIWFPTTRGIARIQPENIRLNAVPPPIRLINVSSRNNSRSDPDSPFRTGPGLSRLEFHFTAPSFSAPEKLRFRAKLGGIDETWRDLGTQRTISYEAVPPGNYRFEVIATNGDGVESETPARLDVIVFPNWWETGWFRVLSFILLVIITTATGWFFTRLRLKRRIAAIKLKHAREAERSRIARDLHDDLGASLTEISLLAGIAAEDAPPGGHREALDEITTKTQHLVGSLDEIVWAIDPRHDHPGSLVSYLAEYGQEFLSKANIFLRLDLPRELPDITIDPDRRHALFLAVREAFNNIVKHSGSRTALLRVREENGTLIIIVADFGQGFDVPEVRRGDGLDNFGRRMEACRGTVSITSAHGSGSRVEFRLPLHH